MRVIVLYIKWIFREWDNNVVRISFNLLNDDIMSLDQFLREWYCS
jgi:hypothetical protein